MRHFFLENTWEALTKCLLVVIKCSLKSLGPGVCKPGAQPFIMLLRVYFGQINSMGGGRFKSHSAIIHSLQMNILSGQWFRFLFIHIYVISGSQKLEDNHRKWTKYLFYSSGLSKWLHTQHPVFHGNSLNTHHITEFITKQLFLLLCLKVYLLN